MILLLIILLFLLQVAILITLTGVRLADVVNRGVAWAKVNNKFKMEAKFISNVDPDDAAAVLNSIDVAHSIFILVSKSGTTLETTAETAYKVAMVALKSGLRVSYFLIGTIKNLLILALGYVATVDIIVFLVAVAGAYSYMSLAM